MIQRTRTAVVKSLPHVAFEVDDLAAELESREIIIPPNSPSDGVLVAFVLENGAPVELLQFDEHFSAGEDRQVDSGTIGGPNNA